MVNPEVIIRDMDLEDIPRVIDLERQLFRNPWPEEVFFDEVLARTRYPFVVQANNEIIGYVMLWAKPTEGHITNIAVDKKYQRKNIAKKLLYHILRLAAGLGLTRIVLEVRPSNLPAISLYESFGFIHGELRKGYYSNPSEDCLTMEKDISILETDKIE
ncbi:MAG: ribosomal protein S18-alanine N-acetyltransferase [FCB group bacterium]|nr:ribosomal protein S18-alanine N-acetyltransferase [FCB group bacterium]